MSSLSEEDDGKSDSDGGDLDKQMGDLNGEEADKLDERLWGDDDEEEEEEEEDSKTEETGPGMDEVIKRFPLSYGPQVERRYCSHQLPFSVIYCSSHCFSSSFFHPSCSSFLPLLDCIPSQKNGLTWAMYYGRAKLRLSASVLIRLLATELLRLPAWEKSGWMGLCSSTVWPIPLFTPLLLLLPSGLKPDYSF